jgi:hypothetical protein
MSVSARTFGVLWLLTACSFPKPADVPSCTANEFVGCDGNVAQTCDQTGDGVVVTDCGAAGCNADAKRCNQCAPSTDSCGSEPNAIELCGADGMRAGTDTCSLGCIASPMGHCAYLEPRYLPDVCDSPATIPAFTISTLVGFDTGLDNNCTGGVVHQEGAANICVVRYGSIDITATGTLLVSGARALALVTDGALRIEGELDVNAAGQGNGPGGGAILSGDIATSTLGGGGAGFATAGANGGSAGGDGGGGLGGGKATDPSLLTVLVGGTRPDRGFGGNSQGSGGGGGAATLISCRGAISITGLIDAAGGGGPGGRSGLFAGSMFAGGGGGAGGNVVLQGLAITVTGQIYANGGGGGAGWVPGGAPGQAGSDGMRSPTGAASGGHAFGSEGGGGAGGVRGTAPGFGLQPSVTSSLPGGGGGSIGFFQTYTPSGVIPTLTPSAASPSFSPNKTVNTH